ncbi:MAG: M23 family metallopeptidase [Candidatus Rokubacteria bacterium]|nr:M23 family metallopeptidase [Candidatus Rokubacteria bacterium]
MERRVVAAATLLVASVTGLAVATGLYLWPGAPAPWLLSAPVPPPATEPRPAFPTTTRRVEVKPGDTLVSALARAGLDPRTAGEVTARLVHKGAEPRKFRPGAALDLTWNFRREPIEVRYAPSPWVRFAAVPARGSWEVARSEIEPDVRVEAVQGRVRRSLFEAVEETGESPQLVLAMVEIFSSDFDFITDTRRGDRFRLLVEKRYARGVFVDYGRILATQYASEGRILSGVGYARGGEARWAYYDPGGHSLKKSFLKSPLEFTRITSGFTYARPHPILGGVRPHLAIDYAAPTGTPVRAVGDGVVTAAGWDGGNGISVTIRHRSGYATMYNHLSKLGPGIRAGARVSQRQVIGSVGATGLATGPHLDYRVSKNGRFVNPLGERFIPGEPIAADERARFLEHARVALRRLEAQAPF